MSLYKEIQLKDLKFGNCLTPLLTLYPPALMQPCHPCLNITKKINQRSLNIFSTELCPQLTHGCLNNEVEEWDFFVMNPFFFFISELTDG